MIADAMPVEVQRGETTSDIDFEVALPAGYGSISGRVLDADESPAHGAMVWIFAKDPWRPPSDSSGNGWGSIFIPGLASAVPVDADGGYKFDGVPEGEYLVAAEVFDSRSLHFVWYPSAIRHEDAVPVPVAADSESAGIDIRIPSFDGVISGQVTTSEGTPIPDATVAVEPQLPFMSAIHHFAHTDADGNYQITGLPDGAYRLSAFACTISGCETRWWPDAMIPSDAEEVIVEGGVAVQGAINFILPLRIGSATISGLVRNMDGTPLKDAYVSAHTANSAGNLRGFGGWAQTDSTGKYVIRQLFEGSYLLQASYYSADSTGSAWYDGVDSMEEATPVVVAANENREGIDFSLEVKPVYGKIAGRVVDAETGDPIDRGYIQLRSQYLDIACNAMPFLYQPGVMFSGGFFELEYLFEGEYRLAAFVDNGSVWYE
jgi:hypothetical protein